MHPISIPSPDPVFSQFSLGPLTIHTYALCIIAGIIAAVLITQRRLGKRGAEPGTLLLLTDARLAWVASEPMLLRRAVSLRAVHGVAAEAADKRASDLSPEGKPPHFVQKIKEDIVEVVEPAAEEETDTATKKKTAAKKTAAKKATKKKAKKKA